MFTAIPAWLQFIVLYFGIGLILNNICECLSGIAIKSGGDLVIKILTIIIKLLSLVPILFGIYFTYYYVDGIWNILLWAYTLLTIVALRANAIIKARTIYERSKHDV